MPWYLYEVVLEETDEAGEPEPGQRFEVWQRADDPPLERHPTHGLPVRRVITSPRIAGFHHESKEKARLEDRNLERKGFAKYVKTDEGVYERTAGPGPKRIRNQ